MDVNWQTIFDLLKPKFKTRLDEDQLRGIALAVQDFIPELEQDAAVFRKALKDIEAKTFPRDPDLALIWCREVRRDVVRVLSEREGK